MPSAECENDDEDGVQAAEACCSSASMTEHCSMMNGKVVFFSKNELVTLTWGSNAAMR